MCQTLHKSGYSEAQITQQQPQGGIVKAKMAIVPERNLIELICADFTFVFAG